MKSSVIALSFAALLAFGATNAVAQTASPAASPAASTAASPAASSATSTKKAATTKTAAKSTKTAKNAKSANSAKEIDSKRMPATTAPTASRNKQPGQQAKLSACADANKGKTGDDYENGFSDCMKASSASDSKK